MKMIHDILADAKTVAIGGHIRPDGDCIGSCLGLYNYIVENFADIRPVVYLEPAKAEFQCLQGSGDIIHTWDEDIMHDLFISLDTSDSERLGGFKKYFDGAKRTIAIDHHITNQGFAVDNVIIPDASSTCEVLYQLMEEDLISLETAKCLYTGMIHDTGVFKYSNTSRRTMEIAGALIEKGIDITRIIDDTFYKRTYHQNQILGRALLESITFLGGRCIFTAIRQKDMDFYQVDSKDLDGIVEQLRIIDGIECAIFLYETGIHEYKVSMRSNNYIDVSRIASYFGGGGHIRAAGATMDGSIHDVVNNLALHIEKQMLSRKEND